MEQVTRTSYPIGDARVQIVSGDAGTMIPEREAQTL